MNRILELFERKNKNILNIYCTAGYPNSDSTLKVLQSLQAYGADMVELGIPYSDPLADGPVIQESNLIALQNGMSIAKLFAQLHGFRKDVQIPVILMGYLNPVLQYGFEKFCQQAAALPVDGLIIPDLPEHEFENEYGSMIQRYGLCFSFLVTPETADERVKKLDNLSSGFLYAVSSSSITGKDKDFSDVEKYIKRLRSFNLKNPILLGFGIKDKQTFQAACKHANGAIIGTSFIKAIGVADDEATATKSFIEKILH